MGSVNKIDTPVCIGQDFAQKRGAGYWFDNFYLGRLDICHFKTKFNGVKSGIHIIQSHPKKNMKQNFENWPVLQSRKISNNNHLILILTYGWLSQNP